MGLLLQEAGLGRRGTLCLLRLLSPSHPFPSQSKPPLARFPKELGSSSRNGEDPVGSVSWGWACRHRDGVRYVAEHQHLLDVGSCEVQLGQGKPWRAWTSPWEGQLWSRELSRLVPGKQRACSSQEDNVSKSKTQPPSSCSFWTLRDVLMFRSRSLRRQVSQEREHRIKGSPSAGTARAFGGDVF